MKKAIRKKSGQAAGVKPVEKQGERRAAAATEKRTVEKKPEEVDLKEPIEKEKSEEVILKEPIANKKPEVEEENLGEVLRRMIQEQEALEKEKVKAEKEEKVSTINLEADVSQEDAEEETGEVEEETEEETEEEAEEESEESDEEDEEEIQYFRGKTPKRKISLVGAIIRKAVFCVSLGVFTYAAVGLLVLMWGYWSSQQEYENIIDNAISMGTTAAPNNEETEKPSQPTDVDGPNISIPGQSEQSSLPILPIEVNVDLLKAFNQDYVMWINIPGTNIHYPVVQGDDNNHYLRYTFQNKENMAGSIFLDYRTPKEDRLDIFNTIIIGHNRQDDTMFSQLLKYQDEAFWEENRYIYLILDGVEYIYEIFAFYELEPVSIVYNPATSAEAYLKHIEEHNSYTNDIEVTEEDRIITLYTCTNDSSGRFLCHAILRGTYNLTEETEK